MADFTELLGKTLVAVKVDRDGSDDRITFTTDQGERFVQYHSQDCCEGVSIDDINGDVADLIGSPILQAEEAQSDNETPAGVDAPEYAESYTWTFYKLATIKGSVSIRWFGSSNGYYSESVYFEKAD